MAFLDTAAPSGKSWRDELAGEVPKLLGPYPSGKWGECIVWASYYEMTTPGWESMPAYTGEGPVGGVMKALEVAGRSDKALLDAAGRLENDTKHSCGQASGVSLALGWINGHSKPGVAPKVQTFRPGAVSDPSVARRSFLDTASPSGLSWRAACSSAVPSLKGAFPAGLWGEAVAWAAYYELSTPEWPRLPEYQQNGPAGQVVDALATACGNDDPLRERMVKAAEFLEQECRDAAQQNRPMPVINEILSQN